jgi:hypothetical protein
MINKKFVAIAFLFLMLLISVGQIVCANRSFYWLVTDGVIDPLSDFVEYYSTWTGNGLEERNAQFKWYVDSGTSRGGAIPDVDKLISGTKVTLSMTSSGNDLILTIVIMKGADKNPSGGPEIYKWTVINGKDSTNDCISIVFTNLDSGKLLPVISLYENDIAEINIPKVSTFSCRMWLI